MEPERLVRVERQYKGLRFTRQTYAKSARRAKNCAAPPSPEACDDALRNG
jgi:hypothetical protein